MFSNAAVVAFAAMTLAGGAHAAPHQPGERLEWAVTWMGIEAGRAWSTVSAVGDRLHFDAGCTSAPWLARLYPIDDLLRSEWRPGVGSARYVTRFREGGFQQDQDMRLDGDPVVIARSQLFDDGWRSWEDRYPPAAGVEDPVSAFHRLRADAGPVGERVRYNVWSGRKPTWLQVWTAAAEVLDGQPALRVEVLTEHKSGDVESKLTVWVSDDADRVPLLAEIKTRAGPVRATLSKRALP